MSALAAEARRLLSDAQVALRGEPVYSSDECTVAAAQVLATLELAEQQRLANIIALAGLGAGSPLDYLALQPDGPFSVDLTDELKKGLKL